MTTFAMDDLGFDAASVDRCWDAWERRLKDWRRFDRVCMTETQAANLSEKMMETGYFSSNTLMHPSIPEFTAVVEEPGTERNTYVCFQKTVMRESDFLDTKYEGLTRTITPYVDAYVYFNNRGTHCNLVVTIAKTVLVNAKGEKLTSTAQLATYRAEDPVTKYFLNQDFDYVQEFLRSVKCIYFVVQMLSTERPEVMAAETVREEYSGTVKKKGRYKAVRKTRFVKVIRIPDSALKTPKGHHEMTCPCWGVAGHWRTYRSGKQVWIKPYRKRKRRHDPSAYQPKQYEIPKEETV